MVDRFGFIVGGGVERHGTGGGVDGKQRGIAPAQAVAPGIPGIHIRGGGGVDHGAGGGVFGHGAGDPGGDHRGIVDIGHCRRQQARHLFRCPIPVRVARQHMQMLSDLGLRQRQGAAGRIGYTGPVGYAVCGHLPLVADRTHAIGIGQRVVHRQHTVLCQGAGNGHNTGRGMVGVGDRQRERIRYR